MNMKNHQGLLHQASHYVQQTLGEELLIDGAWAGVKSMPRYIAQIYDITKAKLAGKEVLLITNKNENPPLHALLRQRALIQKESGLPVVWINDKLQGYMRKELVVQQALFIIPKKQIYLPIFGVSFKEASLTKRAEAKEKLHVATQVFLINAVLGNFPGDLNTKELAKFLGYSLMTMTRIRSELLEHGWLDVETYDDQKIWKLVLSNNMLWEEIKPYLQNPIRKRIWVRGLYEKFEEQPLAGLSALAEQTMLGNPPNVVRAIGELHWRKIEKELTDKQTLPEPIEGAVELEIWRYIPQRIQNIEQGRKAINLFCVDACSLFLSLENMHDERVQLALKELMEKINL